MYSMELADCLRRERSDRKVAMRARVHQDAKDAADEIFGQGPGLIEARRPQGGPGARPGPALDSVSNAPDGHPHGHPDDPTASAAIRRDRKSIHTDLRGSVALRRI